MIVGVGTGVGFGGALAWTPTNLGAGCSWFLADRGVTIATGVSAWGDQSGQGRHLTQGVGGSQPAWSATSFGGAAGITFDGLAHYLGSTAIGALASGDDKPVSIVYAAQRVSVGDWHVIWSFGNSGSDVPYFCEKTDAASKYAYARQSPGTTRTAAALTGPGTTSRHCNSTVFTGTAISLWEDGVATSIAATSLDANSMSVDQFAIGCLWRNIAGSYADLVLGGLIVVNRALTDAERALCEAFLRSKCGM